MTTNGNQSTAWMDDIATFQTWGEAWSHGARTNADAMGNCEVVKLAEGYAVRSKGTARRGYWLGQYGWITSGP